MQRLIGAVLLVSVACGSSTSTIGPLTIDPPDGWFVTDRGTDTLKVTNGTIGEDTTTKAGNATAVFDIFTDSAQSATDFKEVLDSNNVDWKDEHIQIDAYDATIVSYGASAFGPSSEVVFIPDWRVRIVYRAAFGDQESAFVRYRPQFREALRSITFEGRPADRASGVAPASSGRVR